MKDERFMITGALGCIGAWSCAQLVREDVSLIMFRIREESLNSFLP